MRYSLLVPLLFIQLSGAAQSAVEIQTPGWQGKFEQLGQLLPTPNEYRTGSGSPGPAYWQQKADYVITAELNDEKQIISGSEIITYSNNSPDPLKYLWVQLDQNINSKDNNYGKIKTTVVKDSAFTKDIGADLYLYDFDGGYKITAVKDISGKSLHFTINQTMMRIDLPVALASGQKFSFSIGWWFNINDRVRNVNLNDGRSGMEYFPDDGNYLYIIGQWFPRMCVYDDVVGWQNKQFLGQGEFTLAFGDYTVNLTVPADHIVAGTGMVQNLSEVLTPVQYERFLKAKTSYDAPVIICTQEEAIAREKVHSKNKTTWKFYAENVRDFAFATSRKFVWDAQAVKIGQNSPLAMSYYPKEGNPLWEQYSTSAVKNTLVAYSKYTLDYPYPQATSVHAAGIGMEYPMICFNGGRPERDGTIPEKTKWGLIGVVVHEVGHNFFPMIINSDERQWTWMDEGLNTFVEYRTKLENYPDMPVGRGPAKNVVPYMKTPPELQRPLMINSEEVIRKNFGAEQYGKCGTALNILRETVMGPELFDKSFKEYSQRWAFHHPKPADFFRTMEEVSAVDLDWFWRGWFYTSEHCDVSLDKVRWFKVQQGVTSAPTKDGSSVKSSAIITAAKTTLNFNGGPELLIVMPTTDPKLLGEFRNHPDDSSLFAKMQNKNFYEVTLSNKGGLVMPVIIEWTFKDGTKETERIPAEIWRVNETRISKVFTKDKEVTLVTFDPLLETSDINIDDNTFPHVVLPSKFDELKKKTN